MTTERQRPPAVSLRLTSLIISYLPLATCHLLTLSHLTFAVFIGLALVTPSWRVGPFTWWPIWESPMLAGRPAAVGVLSLLPVLAATFWLAGWVLSSLAMRNTTLPVPISRRLGKRETMVLLPLVGLSLLNLSSLTWDTDWRTTTLLGSLILFWFTFIFSLYEKPPVLLAICLIIWLQSGAAVLQFLLQHDLGLAFWGELKLDPVTAGASVLWARGRPWLRGYGLTAHPNVLGATLVILLLWLLPAYRRSSGRRRTWLAITLSGGLMGLFVTFSRAAWLGFLCGMILDFGAATQNPKSKIFLLVLPAVLLLLLFGDLVAGRFLALDTPGEMESISQRVQDMRLALTMIAQHPWQGVGAGNYLMAALPLNPEAETVHNVPLLVAAELGLPGAALWLWLALAPFLFWILDFGFWRAALPPATLSPWLAMLVIGLFDNSLWWTTSWRAAIVFGLLAAEVVNGKR